MNPPALLSFDEALASLLAQGRPVADTERVALAEAADRILAEPITSPIDVPGDDNAQMDGYAVRVDDVLAAAAPVPATPVPAGDRNAAGDRHAAGDREAGDREAGDREAGDRHAAGAAPAWSAGPLPVSQRIAAGQVGQPLRPGTVARIFTGAPMPAGADAVVMQEATRLLDRGLMIDERPQPGAWVRRRAEDIAAGARILPAGACLTPMAIGLAASVG
ncbi:MAG: hypothetical protein QM674_21605, partial [Burkholderiaceae bacterium]